MPPDAYIVHQIPGRVRFKVPARRGDTRYFEETSTLLAECRGVHLSQINPTTGSLLIRHEGDLTPIMAFAKRKKLFQIVQNAPPAIFVRERAGESFKAADSALKSVSNGGMDLLGVLFLGLVALAIHQALEGNIWAPASTLLWYAFTLSFFAGPGPA